jgi:6,7-dimethyl-8-ribityllumazine synthase
LEEDERQPYDHDLHEESSEDVLSALVEPEEAEAVADEEEDATALEEPEAEQEPAPEPEPESEPVAQHAPPGFRVPNGYATLEGSPIGEARSGVTRDAVTVVPVPGAFELPLAAMALAKTRRFACVVALGCVIRGETPHFDYIAGEAASGLQLAALETGVPVAFGVLTCETVEQAEARIERAADVTRGALEMADLFGQLRAQTR